ncbi:MAG: polysaccharide deacetylase family protein [Vicinamibacterales bacterium]
MGYARRVRLKRAFAPFVPWTGWPAAQRWLTRSRVLILTYHGVARGSADSYVTRQSVDAAAFDAQLRWLSHHYRFLRLTDVVGSLQRRSPLPERGVVITFDDGLRNVLQTALPILRRRGAPATVFVCADYVGGGLLWTDEVALLVLKTPVDMLASPFGDARPYPLRTVSARERAARAITTRLKRVGPAARAELLRRLRVSCEAPAGDSGGVARHWAEPGCHDLLAWDDVRQLADAGIEIGSHGCSHTVLTALTDDEARDEIVRSKLAIERELDRPCELFSYPNGGRLDFSSTHGQMLIDAGYQGAATQIAGFNGPSSRLTELRRVNVARVSGLGYVQAAIARAGW